MEILQKYQGDEIAFDLELYSDFKETEPIDIDGIAEIIIYVYTDGCKMAKLSKTSKDGYTQLKRNTQYRYSGIINSSDTRTMASGTIFLEINVVFTYADCNDGKFNIIRKSIIGTLLKSAIKIES